MDFQKNNLQFLISQNTLRLPVVKTENYIISNFSQRNEQ